MASPYKRRRPSIVRNFWIYRRLVGLAAVLGLMLWFIWANNAEVTVNFPFGLSSIKSSAGLLILMSAMVGSVATALTITIFLTWTRLHGANSKATDESHTLPDDRPPADYAAKASEATPEKDW